MGEGIPGTKSEIRRERKVNRQILEGKGGLHRSNRGFYIYLADNYNDANSLKILLLFFKRKGLY